MNVPIKMLGIITALFWIILISFIVSAGYALKSVNFNVGKPEFIPTPAGDITFSLPLYVDNAGYYDLKGFNITTAVYGQHDEELAKDSTYIQTIPKGQQMTIAHNATLKMEQLTKNQAQILFNDTKLTLVTTAGFDFAELMPTQLTTNFTYEWGAPFHNLALGPPQYNAPTRSGVRMTLPMSFNNHAAFDIVGNVSAKIYDNTGKALSESQTTIFAPSKTHFAGELVFLLPIDAASAPSSDGQVELFFETSVFKYGPLVIPYG
jgi:hypothetical protein